MLLAVELPEQTPDARLGLVSAVGHLSQLAELRVVFFVPFQRVPVLAREFLELLQQAVDLLLELSFGLSMGLQGGEEIVVAPPQSRYLLLNVTVYS